MPIPFFSRFIKRSDPGDRYEAVDISSTDWVPAKGGKFRALWISVTGNVIIQGTDVDSTGAAVNHTFSNVPVGMLPCGGIKVIKTSTTATVERAVLD